MLFAKYLPGWKIMMLYKFSQEIHEFFFLLRFLFDREGDPERENTSSESGKGRRRFPAQHGAPCRVYLYFNFIIF